MSTLSLPTTTRISQIQLRVRSRDAMARFYGQGLGLARLTADAPHVDGWGGPGRGPRVLLLEDPGAPRRGPNALGLHHLALRYPTRLALSRAFRRLMTHGYVIEGATDHGVAESLYLSDPEGNGVELFYEFTTEQRSERERRGALRRAHLNLEALRALSAADEEMADSSEGIEIGHLHFQVADLASAERFFHGFLGFAVRARVPGAIFLTATDEHHQIAANVWSQHVPSPAGSLGLMACRIQVSGSEILHALRSRAHVLGYRLKEDALDATDNLLRIAAPHGWTLEIERVRPV